MEAKHFILLGILVVGWEWRVPTGLQEYSQYVSDL